MLLLTFFSFILLNSFIFAKIILNSILSYFSSFFLFFQSKKKTINKIQTTYLTSILHQIIYLSELFIYMCKNIVYAPSTLNQKHTRKSLQAHRALTRT